MMKSCALAALAAAMMSSREAAGRAALATRHWHGVLRVSYVGFRVEDLEHALGRRQRSRQEIRDAAHELQRHVELRQVAEKGEELAEGEQIPIGNQPRADRRIA